jgi:HTH-type transcriptional regulator / antitoxin HipB
MDSYTVQSLAQLSLHLKSLRKARGMTQSDLAKRIGVSQGRYAQIERKPGVISTAQLFAILTVLNADIVLQLRSQTLRKTKPVQGEDW